jgi:hypothetical protein
MFTRRNASAERLGLRGIERREIDEARRKDAEYREMMLEAMRGLGFEACCETFAGHVMGRPDASPQDVNRFAENLARMAWAEMPAE